MNESSASHFDKEADASPTQVVIVEGLQKATDYLETRYNLWKRRSVPAYAANAAELKVLEKAAGYCLAQKFDVATYFQAQVDDLEGIEAIANYKIKDFSGVKAVERANAYRAARQVRDKAILAQSGKVLLPV